MKWTDHETPAIVFKSKLFLTLLFVKSCVWVWFTQFSGYSFSNDYVITKSRVPNSTTSLDTTVYEDIRDEGVPSMRPLEWGWCVRSTIQTVYVWNSILPIRLSGIVCSGVERCNGFYQSSLPIPPFSLVEIHLHPLPLPPPSQRLGWRPRHSKSRRINIWHTEISHKSPK